jgi:hypothetical protein
MLIANGGAVITTLLGVLALLFPSSVELAIGFAMLSAIYSFG